MIVYKEIGKSISDETLNKWYDLGKFKTFFIGSRTKEEDFNVNIVYSYKHDVKFFKEMFKTDNELIIFAVDFDCKEPFKIADGIVWWSDNKIPKIKASESSNKANFIYEHILKVVGDTDQKMAIINSLISDETTSFFTSGKKIIGKNSLLKSLFKYEDIYYSSLEFKEEKKTYPPPTVLQKAAQSPAVQPTVIGGGESVIFSPSIRKVVIQKILKVTMGKYFDCFKANDKVIVYRKFFEESDDKYLLRTLKMYKIEFKL